MKNLSIARLLGFTSEQSFYRNFKKFTGMTPAQWKRKNSASLLKRPSDERQYD